MLVVIFLKLRLSRKFMYKTVRIDDKRSISGMTGEGRVAKVTGDKWVSPRGGAGDVWGEGR